MDPIQREIVELKMRIERLELVVRQLGGDIPATVTAPSNSAPAYEAEVRQLLAQGNEIGAIKLYRENTGCSLAEAQMRVQEFKR